MKVVYLLLALGHLTQFGPTFHDTVENLLWDASDNVDWWCEQEECRIV